LLADFLHIDWNRLVKLHPLGFGLFGFFNAASGLIVVVPLIKSGKGRTVVVVVVALKVSVPLKG